VPMVASNDDTPAKVRAAIREESNRRALVALTTRFEDSQSGRLEEEGKLEPRVRTVVASVLARSPNLDGKQVLVEAVTIEDGLKTKVGAGELKGKQYSAHFVAKRFAFQTIALSKDSATEVRFESSLDSGADPKRTSVAMFIQDEATGEI